MQSLKAALTTTSFKIPKVVGERVCSKCMQKVLILEAFRDGKMVQVSECLNCENLGIQEEHERYVAEMKKRANEITYERYSIIPDSLLSASFDNYRPGNQSQEEALKKAMYYADKFGELDFNSLLFKGTYGIGKSHLSKSIADTVKDKGKTVIFVDVPGLLKHVKNTFGTKENAYSLYKSIETADLVVFDDLGAENVKTDSKGDSWASSELFEIITSRAGKCNVITTNCSSNELREKYGTNGGRIVSRLMQGTKAVIMEGKDMRLAEF